MSEMNKLHTRLDGIIELIDRLNYRLTNTESRLSAIEQREARRENPAEQPQPGAGVESVNDFVNRYASAIGFPTHWQMVAARDAAITAAARAKAIEDAIASVADRIKGTARSGDERSAFAECFAALRTLKEHA